MLDMKMKLKFFSGMLSLTVCLLFAPIFSVEASAATRQMEKLSRGLAVSNVGTGEIGRAHV